MSRFSPSKKLLLEEIGQAAHTLKQATRGLSIGEMIAMMRNQLGMSQSVLAKLAGIPHATVSRIEGSKRTPNLSTLQKILKALACDVLIVPLPRQPIEQIRRKQARYVAEKQVNYLCGTMSLEDQQPDVKMVAELIKNEEESLYRSSSKKLWRDSTGYLIE